MPRFTAKDIVSAKTDTWSECQGEYNSTYSTRDTFNFIKDCAWHYDLTIEEIKEVFDEQEYPFYYCIEEDEIYNIEKKEGPEYVEEEDEEDEEDEEEEEED